MGLIEQTPAELTVKQDGRTFDHQTLEAIRLMAVELVREGEPVSKVIEACGFNRTTIYKRLQAALQPSVGIKALRSTKAKGRPPSLSLAQERQLFLWINGRDPRQYGLDFGLWTRAVVVELIDKRFGMRLGVTAVGELLAKLGLTPQKPLQRAYQRDPEAIEKWQRGTCAAIAKRAKAEGAEIYPWDESGFRVDTVHGKTWRLRGQTPVVQRPGQRQSMSAASAVNANGAFWYCTYEGALSSEMFVELLQPMMKYRRKQLHMVIDGLPAHKKVNVREYVASTEGKRTGPARRPLIKGEKLRDKIVQQLANLQQLPHLVRSFFIVPSVAYVGDC